MRLTSLRKAVSDRGDQLNISTDTTDRWQSSANQVNTSLIDHTADVVRERWAAYLDYGGEEGQEE